MDEYISREEAVKRINSCISTAQDAWESSYNTAMAEIMERIKHIPAADVQPVKHGRWETWGYIFHGIAWKRCSVCGKTADLSYQGLLDGEIEMATPSICGCCGSRLDGDSE